MTLLLKYVEVEDGSITWRQFADKTVNYLYCHILHLGLCILGKILILCEWRSFCPLPQVVQSYIHYNSCEPRSERTRSTMFKAPDRGVYLNKTLLQHVVQLAIIHITSRYARQVTNVTVVEFSHSGAVALFYEAHQIGLCNVLDHSVCANPVGIGAMSLLKFERGANGSLCA